jgi:hypothetical protein
VGIFSDSRHVRSRDTYGSRLDFKLHERDANGIDRCQSLGRNQQVRNSGLRSGHLTSEPEPVAAFANASSQRRVRAVCFAASLIELTLGKSLVHCLHLFSHRDTRFCRVSQLSEITAASPVSAKDLVGQLRENRDGCRVGLESFDFGVCGFHRPAAGFRCLRHHRDRIFAGHQIRVLHC